MLVHLRHLPVAAVRLDELALAGDLLLVGLRRLRREEVALLALPVVRAVVAAERRQLAIPELPDPVHARVEEGAIVRGDEERPAAPAQVVLEPLEGAQVQVVRRLVEQEEVRRGNHESRQRGPRLLAAGQRRGRARHVGEGEAEPGQRLVDALVERVAAKALEPMLERLVRGLGRSMRRAPWPRARRPSPRGGRRRAGPRCGRPGRP